ncbi:MAG: two-component system response regulator OmpR [Spirochaetae bacterium HGW-Spirochaetae-1]|nr:MAG: two-component system response regulator OmpR [Spirochaetae bacterium HGW-Spirochaetae-1]
MNSGTEQDKRVLIVDDDVKLQKLLRQYLEDFGFSVMSLKTASGVLQAIEENSPHILILDIMLPDRDGFDVLRDVRQRYGLPVIMLTARGEDTDRIIGLELGADDYLPKPFNPRELLARMKAVMRRAQPGGNPEKGREADNITAGELTLDRASHMLRGSDGELELSITEYRILELLMLKKNTVLSRDEIMNYARGRDFIAFERSIDVHISKLRSKVDLLKGNKNCIKTMWGSGYMFVHKE